jgi:hypothetical protein
MNIMFIHVVSNDGWGSLYEYRHLSEDQGK